MAHSVPPLLLLSHALRDRMEFRGHGHEAGPEFIYGSGNIGVQSLHFAF